LVLSPNSSKEMRPLTPSMSVACTAATMSVRRSSE
jgi:hypothetical protein